MPQIGNPIKDKQASNHFCCILLYRLKTVKMILL